MPSDSTTTPLAPKNCRLLKYFVAFTLLKKKASHAAVFSAITGDHIEQGLRQTQNKTIYFAVFTENSWSYLLGSTVILCSMKRVEVLEGLTFIGGVELIVRGVSIVGLVFSSSFRVRLVTSSIPEDIGFQIPFYV